MITALAFWFPSIGFIIPFKVVFIHSRTHVYGSWNKS